ncbi:hypothetical protein KL918_004120 [Ogataea parapolymorpha]|nr:hypothetical protein KL918_004120 [Ogataea parapolymorpha]
MQPCQGPEPGEMLSDTFAKLHSWQASFSGGGLGTPLVPLTFQGKSREDSGKMRGNGGRVGNIWTDLPTKSFRALRVAKRYNHKSLGRPLPEASGPASRLCTQTDKFFTVGHTFESAATPRHTCWGMTISKFFLQSPKNNPGAKNGLYHASGCGDVPLKSATQAGNLSYLLGHLGRYRASVSQNSFATFIS